MLVTFHTIMLDVILLCGIVVHLSANVGLLFRIWWARDCSGLSAKTQCLNAAALTFKYADSLFLVHYVSLEITIMKIIFIASSYLIVLSILYSFKGTYEKRYDTTCVPAIILPIIIWALWIEQDYYWHTLLALGVMLEIVAMVPQFHFISESMHLHTHVILYIIAMAIYVCLYIAHDLLNVHESSHQFEYIVIVAKVAQFIVYLDFFLRILPWLLYRRDKNRMQSITIVVPRENRVPQPV